MSARGFFRAGALLAAALALPACHNHYDDDDHEIRIINDGFEAVVVDIEADTCCGFEDDLFIVPAGESRRKDYGVVYDMDIVIVRQSDGFILFAASFDWDDFDDAGGRIDIVVSP